LCTKLAIECDNYDHKEGNILIRLNLDNPKFSIFNVISQIHYHI